MATITASQAPAAPKAAPQRPWSRWRPFVDESTDNRHRRPADIVVLVVGILLLVLLAQGADDPRPWETNVAEFFLNLPSWIRTGLEWLLKLGSLWAVVVLAGGALLAKRWRLARDLAIAGFVTWLLARGLALLSAPGRRDDLGDIFGADTLPTFPVISLAVVTAMVATAAPYLVRGLRRTIGLIPVLAALAALTIPAGLPVDVLGALILGLVVAAAVHVAFGSPEGRPTVAQVVAAAGLLEVEVRDPHLATDQPWGEVVVHGISPSGDALEVKALGADADDAKLLQRAWHRVWFRGAGRGGGNGLERVNREALVTLLAERAGVAVPSVLAVGGGKSLAVLVERIVPGRLLSELGSEGVTDDVLDAVWASTARLHESRLAHGALVAGNVRVTASGEVQLTNFGLASTPAPPGAATADMADLLASTALLVGPQRAVTSARRVLGAETVVPVIAYLQPPALSPPLRDAVRAYDKAHKGHRPAATSDTSDTSAAGAPLNGATPAEALPPPKALMLLPHLKALVLEDVGAKAPDPVKLQRITWKGFAMVALTAFGVYLLLSQLLSLDGAVDELKSANWWWVGAALVVSLFTAFTDAVATLGSVKVAVAYGPAVVLQYAQKFTGLVVPSSLGTAAMNARFLNLQGVPVATAVTAGLLTSVGGFVVQMIVLVVGLLLTGSDIDVGSIDASALGWVILIGVVLAGVAGTLVFVLPRLRAMVLPRVRQAASDVMVVLRSPEKALRILGGNLGSQLLYAITLGLSLKAFDAELSLPALLVINTASSLFAGMMPVPGGIGVAEASLAAGMIAYGIPSSVAGAAALVDRLVTFYLPPIWGWVGFRWLTKKEYL